MKEKEYMQELSKRVLYCIGFFILILFTALGFSKQLISWFLEYNLPKQVTLITLNPYENISLFVHISFFIAIAITIPFVVYHFLRFASPGLTTKEKRWALIAPFVSLILFVLGAAFGYFMTREVIIPFLVTLTTSIGVANTWSISQFLRFIIYLSLVCGLTFQLPLLCSILVSLGILKTKQLQESRKSIYIGLLVITALVTPPDLFSLVLMAIPLIILFEITIFITAIMQRRKKR